MSRYNCTTSGMEEHPEGEWVTFAEYDDLWKARSRILDENERTYGTIHQCRVLDEALQVCRGAMADIANARDMDLKTIKQKANRIYLETGEAGTITVVLNSVSTGDSILLLAEWFGSENLRPTPPPSFCEIGPDKPETIGGHYNRAFRWKATSVAGGTHTICVTSKTSDCKITATAVPPI